MQKRLFPKIDDICGIPETRTTFGLKRIGLDSVYSELIIQIIRMDPYLIPLIILIIIYLVLIYRVINAGIRVVHQGTFVIVERFGQYYVGGFSTQFLKNRER